MRALLAIVVPSALLGAGLALADPLADSASEVGPAGGGTLDALRLFNEVEVFYRARAMAEIVDGEDFAGLAELVIELEESARMRRGAGAEILVTGAERVRTEARGDEGRVGRGEIGGGEGEGAEGRPEEASWRTAPQQAQAPPRGEEGPQAGAEPAAELPDDGRRR